MICKHSMAMGVVGLGVVLGGAASTTAQAIVDGGGPTSSPAPEWMEQLLPDPNDPRVKQYAEQQRIRKETERELRRFRKEYFGHGLNRETRQIGLSLLRERYNQPELYPLLLEVFEHDKDDVRFGLLDMFAETGTDEADSTLAWEAVFDDDKTMREAARERLLGRVGEAGEVSARIKLVVAAGLQQEKNSEVIAAAGIAEVLNLYEMVPLMIAAQVGGNTQGAAGEGTGNLAWIMIAQQQAFVSDLQPVVSNSAVAFDPTLSVVTEGVVLEIRDAAVITYRTEVFYSLTRMTSGALGRPTGAFGIDERKWWDWYEREWKPWMVAREEG
ncbi:hypothetical protein MNBD_PLANCTO03-2139 [hydrothermal vent metagenome]|uniref:Uncharacterized protein n=1 Tax=hydrothermal vent metagenome TaxID=652676 RepID=A0A3B1DYU7_9ZZZZ